MRVCVLGNSHAGALKLGWNNLSGIYSDCIITFFASPGTSLEDLRRTGNQITAQNERLSASLRYTSGGLSSIDIADYDVFLVYALGYTIEELDARLSSAVLTAAHQDNYLSSLNADIAKMLQDGPSGPIYVAHSPLRAAEGEDPMQPFTMSYGDSIDMVHDIFSPRLTFVRQPQDTIESGWRTKPEFTKGSVRLEINEKRINRQHGDDDIIHMNAAFGERWLRSFLDCLA